MVLFCVVCFFLLFCMCFDVPCSLLLYILIEFLKNSHIENESEKKKNRITYIEILSITA